MNYFVSVFTCILSTSLCGMQKVAHSETLMPGGKSVITSYLHILPKDVEELVAQLLIHAHPALFPPISRVFQDIPAYIFNSSYARRQMGSNWI